MGLIRGEGRLLKEKYMKKYQITQEEAIIKVGKFIDELDYIKFKMKKQKKSEQEIKNKVQERFEQEFMKFCSE